MKSLFISFLLVFTFAANAQKIAWPKNISVNDNASLKALTGVAKQLISLYKEKDRGTYLENMFRFYEAAEMYRESVAALDAENVIYNDHGVAGIQFRSYAVTKQAQKFNNKTFAEQYTDTLAAIYNRLQPADKSLASGYFSGDTVQLKASLEQKLAKVSGKDSITVEEAQSIVRTYNSLTAYRCIKKPALAFFALEDQRSYIIQDSLLIKMKDGASLSAVIVRNRNNTAPQPVILMYNIYAGPNDLSRCKSAAGRDYVGIVLNTRGKKLSPQEIEPFEHDASDIYEAIDWISKQPWCNGKIGMYGGSYLGFSQWSAVKKMHPALKTIVPQVAVGPGIDYPAHNGIFMTYMLRWIKYVSNNKFTDEADFNDVNKWNNLFDSWYTKGASFRSLDSMESKPNVLFQRWLAHPSYDDYWKSMVPYGKEFADINIPILTTTGYYDDDQRGAFYYFTEHQKQNPKANDYMLIGPWDHGGSQSTAAGELLGYRIDAVANISINETVFQWFDHILKDSAMPARLKDHINYEVSNGNEWRSAPSLKAMRNDSLVFYLSSVKTKEGYKLAGKKPAMVSSIFQEVKYTDRNDINDDDPPIEDSVLRSDERLKFISDPLEKDVYMNGSFETLINATLNKKDLDMDIDLYELQPDGKYFFLSRFWGRASYTADREKRRLLQPGTPQSINCTNSYFISAKLRKGSRIVALVGMNKSPQWQVNYGSGKDVSDETMAADGQIPLEIEWMNSSRIKIPVLK